MLIHLRQPKSILLAVLALSFILWFLLQNWHDSIMSIGELSLLGILALNVSLWLSKRKRNKTDDIVDELPSNRYCVENVIARAEVAINCLNQEAKNKISESYITSLKHQVSFLHKELNRKDIQLTVTGGRSVGKTTLIKTLLSHWQTKTDKQIIFKETQPLFTEMPDAAILDDAKLADAVLFLINEDLTDTEYQALEQLKELKQRLILVLSRKYRYLPEENIIILQSLKQRMSCVVVEASLSPLPVKVRKYTDDTSIEEWLEQQKPDVQQLTQRLWEMITDQGEKLIWAATMMKAALLYKQTKDCLNTIRRDQAQPIIDRYQWVAGAAAFANPIPIIDLIATAAISGQMVVDLGEVYQQKLSIEQAKAALGEIGNLMLKLGLIEISTKAITTILKASAITFVAGGLVEGLSAAYLTRLAGLSLVEYFQQQEISVVKGESFNIGKLRQALQNVFQQNKQFVFMQGFVKQGVKHLLPEFVYKDL